MEYQQCVSCRTRYTKDKFIEYKGRPRKSCILCLEKANNQHKKKKMKEEVTPEVVLEVIPEIIPETKAMDWTTVMNIQSVSTKQFLDNIMISNIDIINLIKDYTLDEKIIELIKEEYEGCGHNKPFYTCNHKKQILFIKTRQDWIKHCVDDEGLIYGFIEDTLIKKIIEKAKQKEMEIDNTVNRDKIYNALLEMG
jgi:hypothetical protein